jgi:catechol 2,3-dioxygenase-like lactoylglutathione lyase family enzyme
MTHHSFITGIQQAGIGVSGAEEAKLYFKHLFGMDVLVFDDNAPATLMTRYTGNKIQNRKAILSLNLNGGGGFEIWQFLDRQPQPPANTVTYGDCGIFALKIKCRNIEEQHKIFQKNNGLYFSSIQKNPWGQPHFWVRDQYDNWYNIVACADWFLEKGKCTGGVTGAVIGVRNLEASVQFYSRLMGITEVSYSGEIPLSDGPQDALAGKKFSRALLVKKQGCTGAFSDLLGPVYIELVESKELPVNTIFKNRYWGDKGFIHLCFDVLDMESLKKHMEEKKYTFTVDSAGSFAMENAAGRFCYVEDPDGTLIELVETHKIPILKKFGWFLDLKKRKQNKPLPGYMIRLMGLSKVK